jgi:hypothetical protein
VSYISLDRHWTSGPETALLFLRSLGHSPAAPAGGVRGGAGGPESIDPVQFISSIQSNPAYWVVWAVALHAWPSALLADLAIPPLADSGQTTMCPITAKISILNWAQQDQFERSIYTIARDRSR